MITEQVNIHRQSDRVKVIVSSVGRSGTPGASIKFYDTLQEAMSVVPRPEDGNTFQVRKETDPDNYGFYVYDSTEANGYRYLGERWDDEYLTQIENRVDDLETNVISEVDGLSNRVQLAEIEIDNFTSSINQTVNNFQSSVSSDLQQITAEKQVFESEAQDIKDALANMTTTGKIYDSLAEAIAESPKPADGTPFSVMGDGDNDGYYKFDSTQPDGVKFGRKFDRRIQVESISQLRNYKGRPGEAVDVLGYYEKGDGGDGTFYWDAASTEEDNGGTIIQSTGITNGRWKRNFNDALNVKWFGAKGDAATDDRQSIQNTLDYLRGAGGGKLFFPKGIYMISGTIYIPTNVEIFGQGKGLSIFRALPTAVFDLIIPYLNSTISETEEKAKFLPMAVTDTANYNSVGRVENVSIHNVGFDYNGVECGDNSATEVIIGRADNCHLWEVEFYDCLPGNLNNTSTQNLGSCLLFAFAEDCSITKSVVGASDYESVSVWYLSKRILIDEVTFDIDKPSTFASQDHCLQLARPSAVADALLAEFGEQRSGPLFIYDSTFNMRQGAESGVTSHTGDGLYVKRNYFKSFATNEQLWGVKPFDFTDNFVVSDNVFDFRNKIDSDLGSSAVGLNGTIGLDSTTGEVSGNVIKINNPSKKSVTRERPVIGAVDTVCNNTKVSNNTLEIYNYENKDFKAIAINGVGNQVTDNKTFWIDPVEAITEDGPINLYVGESEVNLIEGNLSYGDTIAKGLYFDIDKSLGETRVGSNYASNALQQDNSSEHPNSANIVKGDAEAMAAIRNIEETYQIKSEKVFDLESPNNVNYPSTRAITRYGFPNPFTEGSNDLNDLKKPGFYFYYSSAPNLPSGAGSGIIHSTILGNYFTQTYYRQRGGTIAFRSSEDAGETWGDWSVLISDKYLEENGTSGTYTSQDGKTVTVENGIITSIE